MDHFSHRLGFFMSVVHHFGGGHLGEKLTHSNLDFSHFKSSLTFKFMQNQSMLVKLMFLHI